MDDLKIRQSLNSFLTFFFVLLILIPTLAFAELHIPDRGTYYCLDHVSIDDEHYEDTCLMELSKPILVFDE